MGLVLLLIAVTGGGGGRGCVRGWGGSKRVGSVVCCFKESQVAAHF